MPPWEAVVGVGGAAGAERWHVEQGASKPVLTVCRGDIPTGCCGCQGGVQLQGVQDVCPGET